MPLSYFASGISLFHVLSTASLKNQKMAQPTRRVSSYHRDNFDADWTFIENGIDLYMSSSVNDAKKIRASCRWLTMYTVVYKLCHAMPHPRGEMIYGNLSQLFTTYVETLTAVIELNLNGHLKLLTAYTIINSVLYL